MANSPTYRAPSSVSRIELSASTCWSAPRFHDLAVLELKTHVGEGHAVVDGRGVVLDHAVDGIAHRGGEALAVGDVHFAVTWDDGNVLDGERQIGIAPAP